MGGGAWYPVAEVLVESTERLLKFLPSAHKYRAYGPNTCNSHKFRSDSTIVTQLNEKLEVSGSSPSISAGVGCVSFRMWRDGSFNYV